ncbi:hypothetical protein F4778DRAFT_787378 [Xylariomycetidae sp. FL2044]|nr:hypothetical protein F4778DRAFT_787378 [Xylariomycetidae sp. FL2044]
MGVPGGMATVIARVGIGLGCRVGTVAAGLGVFLAGNTAVDGMLIIEAAAH